MPELPAVEFTKRLIEDNCLKKKINYIEFLGNTTPDDMIFSESAVTLLNSASMINGVGRWGKQLWLTLHDHDDNKNSNTILLIHLGMTGFIQFKGQQRLFYESSPSNKKNDEDAWPPRFAKLLIEFDDCIEMAFCDARRLAKVDSLQISDSKNIPFEVKHKLKLGFDPLVSMPDLEEFEPLLESQLRRRINIKTLLMEQSFVAGLGNWMVDDVLMLAHIRPQRMISSLSKEETISLHKSIKDLTAISVGANANKFEFPKEWLFHIRWSHGKETLNGLKVECAKIGGRSTFWVPELQK